MKRKVWTALIFLILALVVLVGFYAFENTRGRRLLADLLKEVETLQLKDSEKSPAEIGDWRKDNFYDDPYLRCLSDFSVSPIPKFETAYRVNAAEPEAYERFQEMRLPREIANSLPYRYEPSHRVSKIRGDVSEEIQIWALGLRNESEGEWEGGLAPIPAAKVVLSVIEENHGQALNSLSESARRSFSYLPTVLWKPGRLPGIEVTLGGGEIGDVEPPGIYGLLSLRMLAAIEAGDQAAFLDSCRIYLRLIEGIGYQFNSATPGILSRITPDLLDLIRYKISHPSKSSPELEELQSLLAGFPLSDFVSGSFREQCDYQMAFFGAFRDDRRLWGKSHDGVLASWPPRSLSWLAYLLPEGWWDQNAASNARWHIDHVIEPWRKGDFSTFGSHHFSYPNFDTPTAIYTEGVIRLSSERVEILAQLFVKLEQAKIACALERFCLKTGSYPDVLYDLSPDYLLTIPRDPFSGDDMKYVREQDSFRLYSVGMNLTDENGKTEVLGENRILYGFGDWVWEPDQDDFHEIEEPVGRRENLIFLEWKGSLGRSPTEEEVSDVWEQWKDDRTAREIEEREKWKERKAREE